MDCLSPSSRHAFYLMGYSHPYAPTGQPGHSYPQPAEVYAPPPLSPPPLGHEGCFKDDDYQPPPLPPPVQLYCHGHERPEPPCIYFLKGCVAMLCCCCALDKCRSALKDCCYALKCCF